MFGQYISEVVHDASRLTLAHEQVSTTSRLTLANESDGIKYDPDGVTKPRDHVVGTLDLIQEVVEEPEAKTKHSPGAPQNSRTAQHTSE